MFYGACGRFSPADRAVSESGRVKRSSLFEVFGREGEGEVGGEGEGKRKRQTQTQTQVDRQAGTQTDK